MPNDTGSIYAESEDLYYPSLAPSSQCGPVYPFGLSTTTSHSYPAHAHYTPYGYSPTYYPEPSTPITPIIPMDPTRLTASPAQLFNPPNALGLGFEVDLISPSPSSTSSPLVPTSSLPSPPMAQIEHPATTSNSLCLDHIPPRSSPTVKKRSRTAQACERCRVRKAKCTGGNPCSRCTIKKLSCVYTATQHAKDMASIGKPLPEYDSPTKKLKRQTSPLPDSTETDDLEDQASAIIDYGQAFDVFGMTTGNIGTSSTLQPSFNPNAFGALGLAIDPHYPMRDTSPSTSASTTISTSTSSYGWSGLPGDNSVYPWTPISPYVPQMLKEPEPELHYENVPTHYQYGNIPWEQYQFMYNRV